MFGIDPLVIGSFLVLASGGGMVCPDRAPTKINIVPRTSDVVFDASQTLKQLQNYKTDTVDPYAFHGQTITQAFMKGKINLEHRVRFGKAMNAKKTAACLWYETIEVSINIDPEIVLAKEIDRDKCMRRAVVEHELKHVRVDREIVNQYSRSIGEKLFAELKLRGFSAGPFDAKRTDEVMGKMQTVVQQILELEYQKMGIERQERQREVDSREEYENVDKQCPEFEAKKEQLYRGLVR